MKIKLKLIYKNRKWPPKYALINKEKEFAN